MKTLRLAALCCVVLFVSKNVAAQARSTRVLVVVAHPDDDTDFVGAVYKLTHVLGGKADLCVVTNGEGGYRYATLAEPIYGLKLTQESVGRKALPAIRRISSIRLTHRMSRTFFGINGIRRSSGDGCHAF